MSLEHELTQLIGLVFEIHGDVFVTNANVGKYLTYLLSHPAV